MRPLISYYGGKQRIASQILQHFPPHSVYVEPFCGGAALLFAKPLFIPSNAVNYMEVINDTNERLINFYRVAQLQSEELYNVIQATLFSRREYEIAQQISNDPLEDARRYWVDLNYSYANKQGAGWSFQTEGRNSAIVSLSKTKRIPIQCKRIEHCYIECDDAIEIIKRWDSPQTLFYCDPPYPGANQGHYKGYTLDDWQALCDALDSCAGSYVLSNYPQEIEPKTAQRRVEIQASMSASNGRDRTDHDTKRTEVLWVCDRSGSVSTTLAPIIKRNYKQTSILWSDE